MQKKLERLSLPINSSKFFIDIRFLPKDPLSFHRAMHSRLAFIINDSAVYIPFSAILFTPYIAIEFIFLNVSSEQHVNENGYL